VLHRYDTGLNAKFVPPYVIPFCRKSQTLNYDDSELSSRFSSTFLFIFFSYLTLQCTAVTLLQLADLLEYIKNHNILVFINQLSNQLCLHSTSLLYAHFSVSK